MDINSTLILQLDLDTKKTSPRTFGHKSSHSKSNSQTLDDGDEDKVPKSDLERNTREYHGYHNAHNPAHR